MAKANKRAASRTQAKPKRKALVTTQKQYTVPTSYNGWGHGWGGWIIGESYPGAWQRNVEIDRSTVLAYHAVFACMTLIASDVAKLRIKLVERDNNGIWTEVPAGEPRISAYAPVLRKPNGYQTRIQFGESWMLSKLSRGNTYVLKGRDNRQTVNKLWVLDPCRVKPMVADDGSVFYQLGEDELSGVGGQIIVPAREIIHDRFNCLFHPLCGLSPIFACGLAAMQGDSIQNNSTNFFTNQSMPGGILTAPGHIPDPERVKAEFEQRFSGDNRGRLAVLGDGLKFERMTMAPEEAQMVEQLQMTAEVVCSAFHVPRYKIGIGDQPTYNNIQSLNVEYFSQCLQRHIEDIEACLDEGLGIGELDGLGTELDVENLLRMDSVAQADIVTKLSGGAVWTVDEGRAVFSKKPTPGGNVVYKQHQDHSLEALAKRDESDDPFGTAQLAPEPVAAGDGGEEAATDELTRNLTSLVRLKLLERHVYAS